MQYISISANHTIESQELLVVCIKQSVWIRDHIIRCAEDIISFAKYYSILQNVNISFLTSYLHGVNDQSTPCFSKKAVNSNSEAQSAEDCSNAQPTGIATRAQVLPTVNLFANTAAKNEAA